MADRDYTQQLYSVVRRMIEEHELRTFGEYWELALDILEGLPIYRFYIAADAGYGNLAILTDNLIIDIEGDDDEPPGSLIVNPINTIDSIRFHRGPISTIPESADALLVLLATINYATDVGPYWIADTDEERDYLIAFGKAIMEAIE